MEATKAKFPIKAKKYTAVLKNIEVKRVQASSDQQTNALMARGIFTMVCTRDFDADGLLSNGVELKRGYTGNLKVISKNDNHDL